METAASRNIPIRVDVHREDKLDGVSPVNRVTTHMTGRDRQQTNNSNKTLVSEHMTVGRQTEVRGNGAENLVTSTQTAATTSQFENIQGQLEVRTGQHSANVLSFTSLVAAPFSCLS